MRKSGVKFGLIGSASSLKKGAGKPKPIGSKPAPRRRPPGATSVFDANSDDEDGPMDDPSGVAAVNKRLAAISAKQEKQAKKEYEDALEADPSVFDYDRVYEGMKESRETKAAAATVAHEKEKRQPKYIGNLLKQAKMRAVESDRIFDRKLQKEREEQDKVEGEATMKFVTSAYKKKLMEQKKWELQQKLEEEREQRNDVTKTGMSGFYSNLITKNIAMGGDVEKSANSAFTAGSKRHAATDDYDMQDGNAKSAAVDAKSTTDTHEGEGEYSAAQAEAVAALLAREEGGSDAGDREDADAPSARMVDPRAAATAAAGAGGRGDRGAGRTNREGESGGSNAGSRINTSSTKGDDRGDARRVVSEGGISVAGDGGTVRRRPDDADEGGNGSAKRHRQQVDAEGVGGEGTGGAPSGEGAADGEVDQGKEGLEEEQAAEELEKAQKAAAAVAAVEKKAKKEAAIKSARERFLARKKGP